jgi:hypothetical protein
MRERRRFNFVALDVVSNDFNQHVLTFGEFAVGARQFGDFRAHAPDWADKTIAGSITFDDGGDSGGCFSGDAILGLRACRDGKSQEAKHEGTQSNQHSKHLFLLIC